MIVGEGGRDNGSEDVAGDCGRVGDSSSFDFDSCLGSVGIQTLLPLSMDWPKFRQAKSGFQGLH
jgi:hypothetical protein